MKRQDILHEMGLTPLWVLRGAEESAVAIPEDAAADSVPATGHQASAAMPLAQEGASAPPMSGAPAPRRASPPTFQPADGATAPLVSQPASRAAAGSIASLDWDGLQAAVADCRACGLCEQRKQAVLGVGDRQPDWLFVGEGPGADEDEQGEPFVGQAGKLLDAMLSAVDVARGRVVYIGNAVKCRPPGNRTPEAAEMAACRPYLERQIQLLQPKLIVLLGRAAVHSVLGLERPLGALRGRRHEYQLDGRAIPVVVTYHPAYLLRNLTDKALAWEDLCFARRLLAEARRT